MKFTSLDIPGAWEISTQFITDSRGGFGRMYCYEEMKSEGIEFIPVQINNSYNLKKGTIRGLHYQKGTHAEAKLFRCVKGAIYSVAVDIRPNSSTFRKWIGVQLSEANRNMVYYPAGCAVGYQALESCAEVIYAVSTTYVPGAEAGVRYNDPAFNIDWPIKTDLILSEKDLQLPFWK